MPFRFLVVWLRFILICLNDLYLSGIWRLLALLWSAKNGTQNMGWWKRAKLLSGLQDISAFDYKQACHNRGSPRSEENLYISHWRSSWIPTEKLKTRTNVSAFKPSWTYVCDGRHLRKCSKQRQAHDKNRIEVITLLTSDNDDAPANIVNSHHSIPRY